MSTCCPACRGTIFSMMGGVSEEGGQLYQLSRGEDGKLKFPVSARRDREEYIPKNSNLCLKCAHKVPVELRRATPEEVGDQKHVYYYKDFMVGVCSVSLGAGGGFDVTPALNDEARKEREFFLDETTVKKYLPAALQVIEGTF